MLFNRVYIIPRRTFIFISVLLCFIAAAQAAESHVFTSPQPRVDVQATVETNIEEIGSDGVTRSTRYTDSLLRKNNQVWLKRVIAAPVVQPKITEPHAQFNTSHAARLLTLQSDNTTRLQYVLDDETTVVDVPKEEYATVGFNENWASAYYLVDPAVLEQFTVVTPAKPAPDLLWLKHITPQGYEHIVWNKTLNIAQRIEIGSHNGTYKRIIKVKPAPLATEIPWQNINNYEQKRYADYLD